MRNAEYRCVDLILDRIEKADRTDAGVNLGEIQPECKQGRSDGSDPRYDIAMQVADNTLHGKSVAPCGVKTNREMTRNSSNFEVNSQTQQNTQGEAVVGLTLLVLLPNRFDVEPRNRIELAQFAQVGVKQVLPMSILT